MERLFTVSCVQKEGNKVLFSTKGVKDTELGVVVLRYLYDWTWSQDVCYVRIEEVEQKAEEAKPEHGVYIV